MHVIELPADYTDVLRQIDQDGIDDFQDLVERLRFDRNRLSHIVRALHHKGLVKIIRRANWNCWVAPSSKGRRFAEIQ